MRLFIAIPLNEAMRGALADAQAQMKRQGISASYAPPENLHLTLAFIGEYPDPADVPLPGFGPFPLRLDGVGAFGNLWWAGVEPSAALTDYARTLRRELAEANIPFDRKRFSPHITLARRVEGRPVIQLPGAWMTVARVSLMRSDRGKRGMLYTEVGCVEAESF